MAINNDLSPMADLDAYPTHGSLGPLSLLPKQLTIN